ncbi:MAG TPA: nuclear transport factor 2 family protein [Sphingobium sp.]
MNAVKDLEKNLAPADHWVLRSFDAIDAKDIDAFLDMLTDDHRFVLGAMPVVIGKNSAREQIVQFWELIGRIRHVVKHVSMCGTALVFVESEIDYERLDGHCVTIPGCVAIKLRGDLICEQRAYFDQGALWAELPDSPVSWAELRDRES